LAIISVSLTGSCEGAPIKNAIVFAMAF